MTTSSIQRRLALLLALVAPLPTAGDLQQAFEQASGQALTPFFRQWLHRPGAPQPRVAAASAVASGGGYRLRLAVTQSAPAYALRLPIELNYGDALESRTLSVDRAQQTLTLAVDRLNLAGAARRRYGRCRAHRRWR
ncbi:MAG: hypothetical protein IPJ27_07400 [Candidatus Accumulibacter sp.]|uniref:Uncharacterized protein n=1 Tax=Candidatus Accumulibacter proximus TaxID=2954385 RepID=A0A935PYF0_9PROT|nr:hypothetical protein [Candidatus Accumulibacter proximus]